MEGNLKLGFPTKADFTGNSIIPLRIKYSDKPEVKKVVTSLQRNINIIFYDSI